MTLAELHSYATRMAVDAGADPVRARDRLAQVMQVLLIEGLSLEESAGPPPCCIDSRGEYLPCEEHHPDAHRPCPQPDGSWG